MTWMRRDPVTGEQVIYSVGRGARPSDLRLHLESSGKPSGTCPFCAGAEAETPPEVYSLIRNGRWVTRVFPNKFPIIAPDGGNGIENSPGSSGAVEPVELFQNSQITGWHEVIVDHPDHEMTFFTMGHAEMRDVLLTYRERYRAHADLGKSSYILIFKNHGKQAGASLQHPHSQLTSLPFVPTRVQLELAGYQTFAQEQGGCVFCELLKKEVGGEREILQTVDYLVIAPFASRFRFESWILPRKHQVHFGDLNEAEVEGLARVMVELFARYEQVCGDMPFNLYIHNGPVGPAGTNTDFHWHIEIVPRLGFHAGFELGGGVFVNSLLPEDVAQYLREVI